MGEKRPQSPTGKESLLAQVLERTNLKRALKQVKRNKRPRCKWHDGSRTTRRDETTLAERGPNGIPAGEVWLNPENPEAEEPEIRDKAA